MIYNKVQFITNVVVDGLLIIYLFFLNNYNQYLEGIQTFYHNKITEAFAIVEDPGLYKFFVLGILFLVATIVLIIWIVKITLIVLMSNPIFTALATVLIVSSIFVCANK